MMPWIRCTRLAQCSPRAKTTFMCCRLPWHQRRSRPARSISDGGALFIGAVKRRQHEDGPAGAPHQRRLDEIMAEDMAAEGLAALEVGQPCRIGEGLAADDGVVAPVIAVARHARRQGPSATTGP